MKSKILIRADGSPQIGLGHLVRCFALAQMLKVDFEIIFYCRQIPNAMIAEIKSQGFSCIEIDREGEFLDQLSEDTISVLDGYNFDTDYQRKIN